jgi:uncharacterized surface protein with fasciclin (FAS1) repeats
MKQKIKFAMLIFISIFAFQSCEDDMISETFKTFEEETLATYLQNSEYFTDYYKMLERANLIDLLNAYGTYTCFAPTNSAIQQYLKENSTTIEDMPEEMLLEVVRNTLITREYKSVDFPDGSLPTLNFDRRFLFIKNDPGVIYVNRDSRIVLLDQEVHNGIIHGIDRVLTVNKESLPEVIRMDGRYNLFSQAVIETGLMDSFPIILSSYSQALVTPRTSHDQPQWWTPPSDRVGYTALVESDSVYAAYGINTLEQLKAYAAEVYDDVYPESKNITDPTNRQNSLNRFVSYHFLDREFSSSDFIHSTLVGCYIPGYIFRSYSTTLLENSLIEFRTGRKFNTRRDGSAITILRDQEDNTATNGVFHGIDKILVFDSNVINETLNTRIRIDIHDLFPEMATNKIRGDEELFYFPLGYLKRLKANDLSEVYYYSTSNSSLCGKDEIKLSGKMDFTIEFPPIPAGTYEFRLGYLANGNRGVYQIYFDGQPCGIPLNLSIGATDSRIGWVADTETEDDGSENDKMMKNRGYLKSPNTCIDGYNSGKVMRQNTGGLRKVLTTVTFDRMQPHFVRVKSVEDIDSREFQMDYFEFVPLWYLATEGKD